MFLQSSYQKNSFQMLYNMIIFILALSSKMFLQSSYQMNSFQMLYNMIIFIHGCNVQEKRSTIHIFFSESICS